MLLIAEILLTIAAWRKGWRGWALLPGAIAFFLGMAIGASGVTPQDLIGPGLAIDGTAIVALITMTTRVPKRAQGNRPAELPSKPQTAKG